MPRRRCHRRKPLSAGCPGNGAMLASRHAASRGNGGILPRDALGSAALGMAQSHGAHQSGDLFEALAGVAPRRAMRAAASTGCVHVVGAGLAGLAGAIALADTGRRVILYEAAPQAGGRCRSYFDAELGCRIDNGNHLLLAGNRAALDYVESIGAQGTIEGPPEALFHFIEAATKQRWTVRPNRGVLPWWILTSRRRVPGTRGIDYFAALALRRADPSATVAAVLSPKQSLFRRLWEPLTIAAMNTSA